MSYKQLTENERCQIYTLLKVGIKLKAIAAELNRHPSTITRELKRNQTRFMLTAMTDNIKRRVAIHAEMLVLAG